MLPSYFWQNGGFYTRELLMSSTLAAKVSAAIVRTGIACVGVLPLGLVRAVGACLGRVAYFANTRMATATRQNIAYCLPEYTSAEQQALVKASLKETGKLALETAVVWTRSPSWVLARITQKHGEHYITEALAKGQGVLILAPHIGNWEVLNYYLASLGPVTNMYQPPKALGMDEVLQDVRQRCKATLVPTDRKGLMTILKVLKEGGLSGILPDQTPKDDASGLFAPFLAHHAFTMTLAHKLVKKSGCLPLFAYAKRVDGGFELFINPVPDGMFSEDEQTAVNALSEGIEACVRAVPEQYQWEYKRFKKRLHEHPDPYQKK